jgi:hypothetical protein
MKLKPKIIEPPRMPTTHIFTGRRKKTLEEYEADAHWEGGCLIYPSTCKGHKIARLVYQLRHGDILPYHVCVCHTCDNPNCIRDAHHFLGTRKDNAVDLVRKGKSHYSRGKGIPKSAAHVAALSASNTGKKRSEEARRHMREAQAKRDPQQYVKMWETRREKRSK